jgi:hypothetical protein
MQMEYMEKAGSYLLNILQYYEMTVKNNWYRMSLEHTQQFNPFILELRK